MAVVFISPKKRQKMFIISISVGLVLFVVLVSVWGFFAQPSQKATKVVFNKPKVTLDLKILDDSQFKLLQHFDLMPLQYSYVATKGGKTYNGYVSAVSDEEAHKALEAMGYHVGDVKLVVPGRDDPFLPPIQGQNNTTKK